MATGDRFPDVTLEETETAAQWLLDNCPDIVTDDYDPTWSVTVHRCKNRFWHHTLGARFHCTQDCSGSGCACGSPFDWDTVPAWLEALCLRAAACELHNSPDSWLNAGTGPLLELDTKTHAGGLKYGHR